MPQLKVNLYWKDFAKITLTIFGLIHASMSRKRQILKK